MPPIPQRRPARTEAGLPKVRTPINRLSLPTERKKVFVEFDQFSTLIYGRPGIGKTTFLTSYAGCLLFSCERVSRGIAAYDFNAEDGGVYSWDIFLRGVQLLEDNPGNFKTIGIDTLEALYDLCFVYVCAKRGIPHPSEEKGWGGAWDAITTEFTRGLSRIEATGRNIVYTAHSQDNTIKPAIGEPFNRIVPKLKKAPLSYVQAKTDNILYADYVRDIHDKKTRRVIICSGDELIDAKHVNIGNFFPDILPLDPKEGVEVCCRALRGEEKGISLSQIDISKEMSDTAKNSLINRQRAERTKRD